MAERKAQQKYYPPEWDPSKGSINTFNNSHHLRQRASKLKSEGLLVVRFEVPWNIWCTKCNQMISKGRRYNADKKSVGKYFSTTILDFKMSCHYCSNEIHIQTDPEHRDYKCVSGAKRKTEDWDPTLTGTIDVMQEGDQMQMREDPFKKLEHLKKDEEVFVDRGDQLTELQELQSANTKDDYARNRQLRDGMRVRRKAAHALEQQQKDKGLVMPLLSPSAADSEAATAAMQVTRPANLEESSHHCQQRTRERLKIKTSSIFGDQYKSKSPVPPSLPAAVVSAIASQRRSSLPLKSTPLSRPAFVLKRH